MPDIKILIVDDEPVVRDLLQYFLSTNGYHVDCATNGLDALKLIEKRGYSLIIVDYQMPKLNGVEFVKKVREKWMSLPILAMSASNVKELFLVAGANFFISKPVELKNLKKSIESMTLKV